MQEWEFLQSCSIWKLIPCPLLLTSTRQYLVNGKGNRLGRKEIIYVNLINKREKLKIKKENLLKEKRTKKREKDKIKTKIEKEMVK